MLKFFGYNHSLSPAFQSLVEHLKSDNEIKLIDAYWLEHWAEYLMPIHG